MTVFIGLVSSKGGVGKTTTAINLGSALHYFGRNVIVVDANIISPNVGLQLGAESLPITFHETLTGESHISEAAYVHPSGLKIIPASISFKKYKETSFLNLANVLNDLKGYAEVVLVDTPPGLNEHTKEIMKAVDDVIIVTHPNMPAVTDALKTIAQARELGTNVLGVIINDARADGLDVHSENISSLLNAPVLGVIPHDLFMRKALVMKYPIFYSHPKSDATVAYKKLAAHLIGEEYDDSIKKRVLLSPKDFLTIFRKTNK